MHLSSGFSYLLLFGLVVRTSASPLSNSGSTTTRKCSATITTNYDDLPQQLPARLPIPMDPFSPYRGLTYNNLALTTRAVLGSPPPAGLIPASSPNVVGRGRTSAPSPSNVTVISGGAGYNTVNPTSIAYACAAGTQETAITVPTSCMIAFSGYKSGSRVVRQTVNYEVAIGEVTKAMSVAKLQGFGGVDLVSFELVEPSRLLVTLLLDNFVYVGCT